MYHLYADGVSFYNPLDDEQIVFDIRCTLEMGKSGSLEFRIPSTNKQYSKLTELKTIITVEDDDDELFRGRILTKEKDFQNNLTIYCEGTLSYLIDSVQRNEAYIGTVKNLFSKVIENHNVMVDDAEKQFTVGEIEVEDRDVVISGQSDVIQDLETGEFNYKQIAINATTSEWVNTYDFIQNNLIAYCGGYLRVRRQNGVNYLDWMLENFGSTDQVIEFGVNMLDLNEHVSAESLYTVLIPLGDENLTLEPLTGSPELVDEELVAKYGRIVRTHAFDSVSKPETLLENAVRYMENEMDFPITVTCRAVDMHMLHKTTEAIRLGNTVKIHSEPHEIVRELVCTQIEYDLERPDNTTYTFGNPKQTLTQRYRKNVTNQSAEAKAAAASAAGGGGKGAKDNTDKELEKFYDAWIKVTDSSATINMGVLYEEFKDIKKGLKNKAGIDLDAATGNINIRTFREEYDNDKNSYTASLARISALQDEHGASIDMAVSKITKNEEQESGHYATLVARANELESSISMKADQINLVALETAVGGITEDNATLKDVLTNQVGIHLDGIENNINLTALANRTSAAEALGTQNKANIEVMSNKLNSTVEITASYGNRLSTAENNIATIRAKADKNGSEIELKADKIVINGQLEIINGHLDTLDDDIVNVKKLITDSIDAITGNVGWLASKSIATGSITASGTIKANQLIVSGSEGRGYSVATQAWVQELLNDINPAHSHSVSVGSDGKITLGGVTAEGSGGSFRIADTKAYKDGVSAVHVTSVKRNPNNFDDTYNSSTHSITVHLMINTSNGNTETLDFVVPGLNAYNDGASKNGISSISRASDDSYDKSSHNTTIHILADANDGSSMTNSFTVSGKNAYNAGSESGYKEGYDEGQTAGYNSGYSKGKKAGADGVTLSSCKKDHTSGSTIFVKIVLSNGKQYIKTI